jgi:hypothetical protein
LTPVRQHIGLVGSAPALIRTLLALPQRRFGSGLGAATTFIRAILDEREAMYERVGRKGLADNCRAESRQVCALGHIFRALPRWR